MKVFFTVIGKYDNRKLFTAIIKNDIYTVKAILNKKPDLLFCTADTKLHRYTNMSPLQVAICSAYNNYQNTYNYTSNFQKIDLSIAEHLLDLGADVNFTPYTLYNTEINKRPVIFNAIETAIMCSRWNEKDHYNCHRTFGTKQTTDDSYHLLNKMLEMGTDINKKDALGLTPLEFAYNTAFNIVPTSWDEYKHYDNYHLLTDDLLEDLTRIFKVLLKYGANINHDKKAKNISYNNKKNSKRKYTDYYMYKNIETLTDTKRHITSIKNSPLTEIIRMSLI